MRKAPNTNSITDMPKLFGQKDLVGQVAFVSGGSCGIGRAVVEALAHAGADVAINFISHEDGAEQAAEAVRKSGRRALLCPGDISDYSAVEEMMHRTACTLGGIHVAVANAAYSHRDIFWQATLEEFHRTV